MSASNSNSDKAENVHIEDLANTHGVSDELSGQEVVKTESVTWYKDPALRKLYFFLSVCLITSATNGFDGSMMNGLQSLVYWQDFFNHPEGSTLGLFNAIQSIGAIVALPITPYIADGLGRKTGIIGGSILMLIGVAVQTAAQNFGMFIAARFLVGFGISIAQGTAPLLITELAHPQHRARITSLYNTGYYVGAIIAAATTLGAFQIPSNWAWRLPSLLQAAPSVFQFAFIWWVPESPRYLISKGRNEQAFDILAKYHANGDHTSKLVQFEYDEVRKTLEVESVVGAQNGWMEIIRTPANRKRLGIIIALGVFSQWSGNGLVSYYLSKVLTEIGISDSQTQLKINLGLSCYNGLIACSFAFMVDKFGRRPLFLVSTFGMTGSFIIWTICSSINARTHSSGSGIGVITFIFIYYTFYNFAYSGLLVGYAVEILPYKIRAKGLMILFTAVDVTLFFNQYVNPIGLENLSWKYYIFYCAWLGFECVIVYFYFIETKNQSTLEEMADLFGDGAQQTKEHLSDAKTRELHELEHNRDQGHVETMQL
ncbi:Sugar transporter [Taphrina deformans PYCC 5710]|uniref:Sugar transporter n=1 Tax=Taphrina deformans (strain PYCC 5710 / ATCC 11124 / CBS 356.35 / IMI 108563 / JCM 9778 / NBRC 8474) TaxID=1097556 RepID=R4XAH2_TAPDE|nr:Sugar transporter [Taphrina deformans PYCC 5710]|eukprot:CCG82767.1 Sugar transporter [Taphrina deformans PYCC 5710]